MLPEKDTDKISADITGPRPNCKNNKEAIPQMKNVSIAKRYVTSSNFTFSDKIAMKKRTKK